MTVILSSTMAVMFCLIKTGFCWEDVKYLLLKCHCEVVVSLKKNSDGVLYLMNISIKMGASW